MDNTGSLIIVRGGGDIATGTICRLHRCGYRVVVLETAAPSSIRRSVSLAEAVYEGRATVEAATGVAAENIEQCRALLDQGLVPLLIDPEARSLDALQPFAVIDAILAKRNCGTSRAMAPIVIGLGPGFTAGEDVDAVVETARGHDLGRVIYSGQPLPNTGIPGEIQGFTSERVIHSPHGGVLTVKRDIGSRVEAGEVIAQVNATELKSPIGGIVRGMLRNGFQVWKGQKTADVDPRADELKNCFTISDKARNISGAVLEALLVLQRKHNIEPRPDTA